MADWIQTLTKYTYKKRETHRKFTAVSNSDDAEAEECENQDDDDDDDNECDNISEDVKEKIEAQ